MKYGKIIRTVFYLALFIALMVLAAPKAQPAADKGSSCGDNLTWQLEDGTLTVSGTGRMDNYAQANGYIWRLKTRHVVGTTAPWNLEVIRKVVIGEGVTSVGSSAFYGHPELVSVELPDSLEFIGKSAFENCVSLEEINLRDSVAVMENAFLNCLALE